MKYKKKLTLILLSVILVFGVLMFLSEGNKELSLFTHISAAETVNSGSYTLDADGITRISENEADCSVHKWDGGVITTFATCKVNGVRTYTCENNPGHTYTESLGLNANNHVNKRIVPAAAPTCSEVGYTAGLYCDDCQQYVSGHREIAKDSSAHKWDDGVITAPAACKTGGVKTYTCQYDSAHTYTEKTGVDSANHLNTVNTAEIEATCSEAGCTAGVYCNDCKKYVSGHEKTGINTDNHKWNGGVVTTFATCKVNGVRTYTCEHNPGHTYTESLGISANNHINTRIVPAVAPTCSEVGYTAGRYCDDCGMYIFGHREIAKDSSAHKWDSGVITTPAACKTGGVKTYTCQYDSQHTYNEKTAVNESNHINTVNATAQEPTCSENGYTAGVYCNDCKKYVSGHEKTGINADNHKWDGGVVTTFATCKVNGVKIYTCENNPGHTYTENLGLNVNNHKNTRIVPAVAPTCSDVGYTAGRYCDDCGMYIYGHREIAKDSSAHKWDSGVITTPAACKTGGMKTYTCLYDSQHTYNEKTAVNESNHINTVNATAEEATCSENGYTAGVYCNDCKKYVSGHEKTGINADNHKWDGGVVTTFATCKVSGVKTYTCENNPTHTYTENLGLNVNNHINKTSVSAVAPTCSEVGYTAGIYCEDCQRYVAGHREIAKDISAHKWDDGVITTPAACKTGGVKTYTCQYDSQHTYNEKTAVNESNHINTVNATAEEATCSEAGYTAGVYCNDCKKYVSGHEKTGINADNHKWGGGEITAFSTCKVNGVKTYTCGHNSGHTYTEKLGLNADNHVNTVSASAVEATCSEVGYTAGIYCDDCRKYISGHKETEKNPSVHKNTTVVDEIPATTENAGYTAGVYCSDCQSYISGHTEIPKIEATFTDSESAVKAGKYIFVNCGLPVEELLSQAGKNSVIKDSAGNAVAADKHPVTGMTLMLSDGSQYTLIVPGDVDCDGAVSAADARLVLRAAVGLEQYKENSYQYMAGNVEAQDKLSAADARRILRTAVGLEKLFVTKKDS